jgi:hypothetical protein
MGPTAPPSAGRGRGLFRTAALLLLAVVVVLVWNPWRQGWRAGASVFSGRRDPTWRVPVATAGELEQIWLSLPLAVNDTQPPGPGLGYRGCWLRDPHGREWRAFAGRVELTGGSREVRRDRGRVFELRLLATAPAGVLPSGIVIPSEPSDLAGRPLSLRMTPRARVP